MAAAVAVGLAAMVRVTGTSAPVSRTAVSDADFEHRTPAYPPAMGGPDIVRALPATAAAIRNKIVDSDDLYVAVSDVTMQSATIDKLAAAEALLACADLRPKRRHDPAEVAAMELAIRCAGIHQRMRRNGAVERAIELRMSAEGDSSALGRLAWLAERSTGSGGLQTTDLALVANALKSGDSVLVRAALDVLQVQLNDGLSDSKLRAQAFGHAAADVIDSLGQQAVFDRLVDCANAGRCSDDRNVADTDPIPALHTARQQSESKRLTGQYREALQRGATVSALLAIR